MYIDNLKNVKKSIKELHQRHDVSDDTINERFDNIKYYLSDILKYSPEQIKKEKDSFHLHIKKAIDYKIMNDIKNMYNIDVNDPKIQILIELMG